MGTLARSTLTIGAAAALLAGCDGPQSSIAAPGAIPPPLRTLRDSAATPDVYKVSGPLLFVADWVKSSIQIYDAKALNPVPIATIRLGVDQPYGDCIDSSGTLYVTNSQGWVNEYELGKTRRHQKITKSIEEADACAIDPKGNLWVANLNGYIVAYKKGSKVPYKRIHHGTPSPEGIAIDHSGNIFVSNRLGPSSGNVEVYAPGSTVPTRTITDGVTSPVGITVDRSGTLYVTNVDQNNVEEYPAGQSQPSQTITKGMNLPIAVTVNKEGRLYVGNDGDETIIEFARGSLTPLKDEIHRRMRTPEGLAYYPPALP